MSSSSKTAHVEQSSASKPPFLTLGKVMPEALQFWEMRCAQFSMHKGIPEADMVKKIAWGMQDPWIQDWYLTNQEEIDAITFKEYMTEVCNIWLPLGWADIVRHKMLASMQGQHPFNEWAINVQSQNTLLHGTTSHLPDVNILYHLKSHMNAELATDYHTESVEEEDLCKWIERVHILNEKCLRYLARQKEAIEIVLCMERVHSNADKKLSTNTHFSSNNNTTTKGSSSTLKPFTRLPSLTNSEWQLLHDNDRCFKCCEPFMGHTSSNCTKGFPDGVLYKTLTSSSVTAKKMKKGKDVVTTVEVEETCYTVAVVMLSAVLGNGTDSGEECMALLQTPHLRWDCLIDGPGVSSPINVSVLIDYGSSLVLIGEELADKLGLHRQQLAKPLPISLTLSKDKDSFLLLQYVKLSCTSLDQVYTS
ncbi:uncharacterized protein F5147DRAFT_570230 [Suillus discolor]|uniref:Uncharacterized protein n=1 Tax=Suillus discolor TaxID=1912936 RepID=A0A9P7JY68_9AGAM|nr:uncharacterized protein F5147DRAFT_570230 [Suillus discolor]KAG2114690.1 hypothetical protein F5147DRAFT_570230 [Suillus discolor]